MSQMKHRAWLPLLLLSLAACKPAEDPAEVAAREAAQREAAAASAKKSFEDALAEENWERAWAQADFLRRNHAGTEAAREAENRYAELESRVKEIRAERRLQYLWSYQDNPAGKGRQLTAAIDAKQRIELDGGRTPVQLIFRDHPEWGRSSYLVLKRGDFNCYSGCNLKLSIDGKPRTLRGSRPDTDEAIAMFITDHRALWRIFKTSKEVTIEFPVKPSGTRSATFEVSGLDPEKMPGWN